MSALLLSLAVVAATPRTIAAPGFSAINVDERVANFYSEFFSQELAVRSGLRVVTGAEVATLLGLERQRELLGCSDTSTSCMAELAGALGAEGVVTGSIARLGTGFAVTLKVITPTDARTLAVRTGRPKDEDALLDWLTETAGIVAGQLKAAFAPPDAGPAPLAVVAVAPSPPAPNPRRIARNGVLFTEEETARYFSAKQRGLPEVDALLAAKAGPPPPPPLPAVDAAPSPDAGPLVVAAKVPAAPPRRVARDGKVLSESQTQRYFEARSSGRGEAEAFSWALTTAKELPPAPPPSLDAGQLPLPPLPPGLPRRIAREGKLLSVEDTERYFREKLKLTAQ